MMIGTFIAGSALAVSSAFGLVPGAQAVPLEQPTSIAEAFSAPSVADFCVFGTHHGKGSGCRGGSVAKGAGDAAQGLADDVSENGYDDATIVGCAAAAGVTGAVATPVAGAGTEVGCEMLLQSGEAG